MIFGIHFQQALGDHMLIKGAEVGTKLHGTIHGLAYRGKTLPLSARSHEWDQGFELFENSTLTMHC